MTRLVSRNNRVLLLIGLMAASSFAVGGLVYGITSAQAGDLAATTDRLTVARGIETRLAGAITSQEGAIDDYVLSRAAIAFQRYTDAVGSEGALTTQMAAATADLPDVNTTCEVMEASSVEWRQNVAEPVITALGAADQPGIDRFSAQVGDDHAEVDSAIEH